jgi:Dolichyl-phosphate-mannose-protein mannosyltransferase
MTFLKFSTMKRGIEHSMMPSQELAETQAGARTRSLTIAGMPWMAIAFLALTLAISLIWSHYKLLWQDELYTMQTDSVSSLAQVIEIQRNYPVSLDPLAYHALAHWAIRLFGPTAFAIRLPSLLGFLLMQICLFFFVRRIAGEQAGVFALAFPALTPVLYYSAEARPYGMMLGFCTLALLSWQNATRSDLKRMLPLATLACAITITVNSHFYGVLFLVPLCAAEAFRTFERRRLDLPLIASMALGIAGIVFTLPFLKASAAFRVHYYNTDLLSPRLMLYSYRSLMTGSLSATGLFWHLLYVGLVLVLVFALWGSIRQLGNRSIFHSKAECFFLILLSALPFFGYLLAHNVTHTFEPRYVVSAMVGITSLLAIALSPFFLRKWTGQGVLAVLFVTVAFAGGFRISLERVATQKTMAALTVSPAIKSEIMASPSRLLYFQNHLNYFLVASYYEPDPEVRSHLAFVYNSMDQEMLLYHHDTLNLLATNLRQFTRLNIFPYESVATEPGNHIFVATVDPLWEWTEKAITSAHGNVNPIGPGLEGNVVSVHFVP